MKLIYFLLLCHFILYIKFGYAKTYNCWYRNVPLKYGEIGFFQLGNYPAIAPIEVFKFCSLKFILDEKSGDDFILSYHFVELFLTNVYNYDCKNEISFNQSSFSPFIPYMTGATSITQQGYVIFEKYNSNLCPFESLSKEIPYQLDDETQILTLTNFIQHGKTIEKCFSKCNWRFKGPEGYGFKIWVNEISSSGVEWIVRNSTSVFLTHRTIEVQLTKTKFFHPFYNSDNFIDITFISKNNLLNSRLNISLSLIKNVQQRIPQTCYLGNRSNGSYSSFIWGINYNHGYVNNGYCIYQFILPSNSLLLVQHGERLLLDTIGDVIKAKIGDEKDERDITNTRGTYFELGPLENDINITFEFISDGSFQGLGFQLLFDIYECKCNTQNVPCNGKVTHFYMTSSETYCNNLACNFTFLPCETENSMVTFYETSTFFEVFKVYSDDEVIFDLVDYHEFISNFFIIFKSSAKNILEVIPLAYDNFIHEHQNHPDGSQRRFMFNLFKTPNEKPNLYITISLNFSTAFIDLGLYKMADFEISKELIDQNLTLNIFASDLLYTDNSYYLQIYDNENFTQIFMGDKCFDDSDPYICKLRQNHFIVVQRFFPHNNSPYMAVQLSKKFDACVFDDTVFILKTYGPEAISKDLNISQIASPNANCDITLLVDLSYDDSVINDKHYYISSIFTTAKNENVKVFFGDKNQSNLFFEFNHKTASKWRYISLNSKGYTIEIPKSASLLIVIEKSDNYIPSENFPLVPFQSLLTTPYYAGVKYPYFNSTVSPNYHLYYFWGTDSEREITFVVVDIRVFDDEEIYFLIDDSEKLRVNSCGEKNTFAKNGKDKNSIGFLDNIKLIYNYPKHPRPPRINNGAIFHIQFS